MSPHGSSRPDAPTVRPVPERMALAVASFLAAAAAGLLPVYAKWHFLQASTGGFLAISRLSGGSVEADLGMATRLSFLAWDVLASLVLLPLLIGALGYRSSRRVGGTIVTIYCLATLLWSFAAMLTMSNVGRFPSPGMWVDAVGWARGQPDFLGKYISLRAIVKLGGLGVLCGLAYAFGWHWIRRRHAPGQLVRFLAGEVVVILGLATALLLASGATAWRFRQAWPYQSLTFADFSAELRLAGWMGWGQVVSGPDTPLVQSRACAPSDSGFTGTAGRSDLVVIVLESVAAEVMEEALEEGLLPGIARARAHALVANQHYTSHPFSSDAVFSILTGRYPSGRRELVGRSTAPIPDALGTRLVSAGYQTRLYVPFLDRGGFDQPMYQAAGIQQLFVSEASPSAVDSVLRLPRPASRNARLWPGNGLWSDSGALRRLAQDRLAWSRMVADLGMAKARGESFAGFILPQVGHGPWKDDGRTPRAASMARLVLQDQWIGDLIDLLEARGWDTTTVLVITGDHGVRTRTEDPALEPGQVSRYTFGVPLVMAAPGALPETVIIDHPTSHVDLAVTLADFLGLEGAPEASQGLPLWCESQAERLILLLAEDYFGVNGILAGRTCLAYSRMMDAVVPCAGMGLPSSSTGPREAQLRQWLEASPRLVRRLNLDAVARVDPP